MDIYVWYAYAIAATIVALTPGPSGLLAMSHGVQHGLARAILTILGGISGFAILMIISLLGLGALIVSSPSLFFTIKVAGAAYLIFLGLKQVFDNRTISMISEGTPSSSAARRFSQGFYVASSNPKVILFYISFLPQFIDDQRGLVLQLFILIITFSIIEFVVEFLLACFSVSIVQALNDRKIRSTFNWAIGSTFVAIGLYFLYSAFNR